MTSEPSVRAGDKIFPLPKPPQPPPPKEPPPVLPHPEPKEYGFPPPPIIRKPKPKGR